MDIRLQVERMNIELIGVKQNEGRISPFSFIWKHLTEYHTNHIIVNSKK